MENNIEIKSIEDIDIKNNSFIVIASKRNSGKTVLTKNLIKYLYDTFEYNWACLFSDTAGFNGDYDNVFEKELIFKSEQLDDKVEKILKLQEKSVKNKKLIHGLIVLDDVKIYKKSKILIDLSTKSRHYKLTVIGSVQYPKELISSSIRSNIDYLFSN